MSRWPLVQLRRIAHFAYGDSLADANRVDGQVPVYGSNGIVGQHDEANTLAPALIVGRKGSFGKVQYSDVPAFAIDTTFFVDSAQCQANLRWLYYALGTLGLDSLSEDVGVPGLSREKAYEQRLPLPPIDQQRAIADYLDAETARIDALIEKKRALMDGFHEREQAQIAELLAAAEGCSRTIRLGQVLDRLIDYRGATPEKTSEGVPLLTASNIVDGRIDMEVSQQFVSEEVYADWMHRGLPEAGDILMTTEAPLGEVALVDELRVALAQRLMLLRVRLDLVRPDFFLLFLRSPKGQAELLSRASGSTVMGVRTDRLREVIVQVPSLGVQDSTVATIRRTSKTANAARSFLQRQIDLLVEHRQALIAAAVTGELDGPGVAA